MKVIKDIGDGYQIVQYGEWQAWDKDGNYSNGLPPTNTTNFAEITPEFAYITQRLMLESVGLWPWPTPPTEGTPDSRLTQAIKETMRELGINSGGSSDE